MSAQLLHLPQLAASASAASEDAESVEVFWEPEPRLDEDLQTMLVSVQDSGLEKASCLVTHVLETSSPSAVLETWELVNCAEDSQRLELLLPIVVVEVVVAAAVASEPCLAG